MTLTQIKCFLAAAENRSFSITAQKLYMSQPTFGRQIAAMERELGFPLFVRASKGNLLTAAGEVMYQGLSRLYPEYLSTVVQAQRVFQGDEGELRLGLLEGQLLDAETSRLLHGFQAEHDGIQLEIQRYGFHAMLEALRSYQLDVGITLQMDVEVHSEFDYMRVYALANQLVLPKDHPLAGVPGVALKDFADDIFVEVAEAESSVISAKMRQTCRAAGFEPSFMTAPDLKSQILCVESGLGIAAFNMYHQACNHPNLVHIPLPDFPPVDFCAVWMKECTNPAVYAFLQTVRNVLHGASACDGPESGGI